MTSHDVWVFVPVHQLIYLIFSSYDTVPVCCIEEKMHRVGCYVYELCWQQWNDWDTLMMSDKCYTFNNGPADCYASRAIAGKQIFCTFEACFNNSIIWSLNRDGGKLTSVDVISKTVRHYSSLSGICYKSYVDNNLQCTTVKRWNIKTFIKVHERITQVLLSTASKYKSDIGLLDFQFSAGLRYRLFKTKLEHHWQNRLYFVIIRGMVSVIIIAPVVQTPIILFIQHLSHVRIV